MSKAKGKKSARKWTAQELKDRIARRHPIDKGWFTCTEFCPQSGAPHHGGRMDALSVCLYTSRGFAAHGFEVKVSRSDWLTELNNPSKNSVGLAEVDFWSLVVPSTEIAKVEELPPKWGLFTCSGKGLRETKRAERLKDESAPFSRAFVVSLLWKIASYETPGAQALEDARLAGVTEGQGTIEYVNDAELKGLRRERTRLLGMIEDFEKRAGCHLGKWHAKELGILASLLNGPDLSALESQLNVAQDRLTRLVPAVSGALKAVEKLAGVTTAGIWGTA